MKEYIVEVIIRKHAKKFWFRLKGSNGVIMMHSEMYSSRQACVRSAKKICRALTYSTYMVQTSP